MAEGYLNQSRSACLRRYTKKSEVIRLRILAPQVGLEPTTTRLTAGCSAIELLRITCCIEYYSYMKAKMQ